MSDIRDVHDVREMGEVGDIHGLPPHGGAHHADGLVILAKYPQPGKVKTRLGATIGLDRAAQLYRAFLADLRDRFDVAQHAGSYTLRWACAPNAASLAPLLGPQARLFTQQGDDLGERLYNACVEMYALGYERLVILGSDAPQLPASTVARAFVLLNRYDAVLGPAEDGGYYLAGLHLRPEPADLFRGIHMSTPDVLRDTLRRAATLGHSVALLEPAFDIDEAPELARLATALCAGNAVAPHTQRALARVLSGDGSPERALALHIPARW
jgi:uncharacterized protein